MSGVACDGSSLVVPSSPAPEAGCADGSEKSLWSAAGFVRVGSALAANAVNTPVPASAIAATQRVSVPTRRKPSSRARTLDMGPLFPQALMGQL